MLEWIGADFDVGTFSADEVSTEVKQTIVRRGLLAEFTARKKPLTKFDQYSSLVNGAARFFQERESSMMTRRGSSQNDNISLPHFATMALVTLKMRERCGNVTENKALHFLESERCGNAYEKKGGSY